jgi:hypothetical protein
MALGTVMVTPWLEGEIEASVPAAVTFPEVSRADRP